MKNATPAKLLAAALLIGCSSLSAAMVQYSTNGAFSNNGTPTTGNLGGITLTFVSASGLVNANPTSFVGFGNLVVTSTSATPVALPAGLTLAINIIQSLPSAGMGQLSGTIMGSLSGTSSAATFTPSAATLTLGLVTYSFSQTFYALVPPSSNNGDTSIQGAITVANSTNTPEAGTLSMLCGGLLMAVGGSRKLRARFV